MGDWGNLDMIGFAFWVNEVEAGFGGFSRVQFARPWRVVSGRALEYHDAFSKSRAQNQRVAPL